MSHAQNMGFVYSGDVKFLNSANDTLLFPFTGGFTAPQFNNVDLNGDNKKDLVVFDRAGDIIHPFIYTGTTPGDIKYRYAPEYRQYLPRLTSWVQFVDFDGDGKEDIFTQADPNDATPDTFIINNNIRVFRNTSQGNTPSFALKTRKLMEGYPKAAPADFPSDTFPNGLYCNPIDRPCFVDIDNDGDLDMLTMFILSGYVELWKNFQVEKNKPIGTFFFRQVDPCWGGILISERVQLGITCYKYYFNFKANAHFGTTIAAIDLDGDGDKELISGDVANDHLVNIKNGRIENNWKHNNISADTMIAVDTIFPRNTVRPRFQSGLAAFFVDIDNDGKLDMVVSTNNTTGMRTKAQIWAYRNTGTSNIPVFTYLTDNFLLNQTIDEGGRFAPALIDYDRDGKTDLLAGTYGNWEQSLNTKDRLVLFRNVGSNTQPVFKTIDTNYLRVDTMNLSAIRPAVGDINRDGKPDILLGLGNGTMVYFENNSTGSAGPVTFARPVRNFAGISVPGFNSPAIFDLNFDGKNDLIIGNESGSIYYYRNKSVALSGYVFQSTPDADSLGQINVTASNSIFGFAAPALFNVGNDSMIEMLVGTYNGRIRSYRINVSLEQPFEEIDSVLKQPEWTSYANTPLSSAGRLIPCVGHFTNDTLPDLLVGTHYGGLHFYKGVYRGNMPPVIGYDTVKIVSTRLNRIAPDMGYTIYPNPAQQDIWIIRTEPSNQKATIEVRSVTGNLLLSIPYPENQNRMCIEDANIPKGILIIRILNQDGTQKSWKILKL
jgi:hypothetical protein